MHYRNGRAAVVGDLVRGKGYNFPYEITGVLISAQPEASACNCSVATVSHKAFAWKGKCGGTTWDTFKEAVANDWGLPIRVDADLEYGQLDGFVAIDPETGKVLPPADGAHVEEPVKQQYAVEYYIQSTANLSGGGVRYIIAYSIEEAEAFHKRTFPDDTIHAIEVNNHSNVWDATA